MNPEEFVGAGGSDLIHRAVAADLSVKAAKALNRTSPQDAAQDGITSLLTNFRSLVSRYKGNNLFESLVDRAVLYAKSACEKSKNGSHSRHRNKIDGRIEKRKMIRHVYQSDCVTQDGESTFEATLGSSRPHEYRGGLLDDLPRGFRRALYCDRHDLFAACLQFLIDPESGGWETTLEIRRAYSSWATNGKVPNPGKVGIYSLPPLSSLNSKHCPIPSNAELLFLAGETLIWASPDSPPRNLVMECPHIIRRDSGRLIESERLAPPRWSGFLTRACWEFSPETVFL